LDEHETFARERGYTRFDVRGGPRRRETVRQLCDEASAPPLALKEIEYRRARVVVDGLAITGCGPTPGH
jgi:hypothetical protein